MMHGWGMMRGFGRRFLGGGMFMGPLLWLVIIGVGIYIFKQVTNNQGQRPNYRQTNKPEETPLEIARRRYAEGEIDKEEFQQIKNELK